MDTLLQDLRYATRRLLKSPGFAALVVLTLGLGIGATTVIFSAVHALVVDPFSFPEPDRIVSVSETTASAGEGNTASPAIFSHWRQHTPSLGVLAAGRGWGASLAAGSEQPEPVAGYRVTADWFRVLGSTPAAGRTFVPGEDAAGAEKVVVLSHRLWLLRFQGSPAVVGKTISLDGEPHTVVGVVARGQGLPVQADVWTPLPQDAAFGGDPSRSLQVFGRLRPGVEMERGVRELQSATARFDGENPSPGGERRVRVETLRERYTKFARVFLALLFAAVGAVLLIAVANTANLLLARATSRVREVALRVAVGARPWRLVRQLLTESLVLSALGGIAGIALSYVGIRVLRGALPGELTRLVAGWDRLGLNPPVLAFTVCATMLAGVLFGLAPALSAARTDPVRGLRSGGRGMAGDRQGGRLRRVLVVAEVALALVLVVAAGSLLRGFDRLLDVDPGFSPGRVLTLRMAPPASATEGEAARAYEQVVERAGHLPGVEAVGVTSHLPFSRTGTRQGFSVEGQTRSEAPVADLRQVTPGYFAAMGVPVLRGRALASGDGPDAPRAVVVSEGLARRYWPGADPRGRRLSFRASSWEVVGVVGDVLHQGLGEPPSPTIYVAQQQAPSDAAYLVVRTATDPAALAGAVRDEIARADRGLAVSAVAPMRQVMTDFAAPERITVQLLTVFALCALVIAVGGIYGVVSYGVAQRTQEIGTRLALGAQPNSVVRLVMRQGLTLALAGVALGTAAAYAVVRLLSSFFFGVEATGVLIPLGSGALMVLAALVASYLPAREAVGVDPMLALRRE